MEQIIEGLAPSCVLQLTEEEIDGFRRKRLIVSPATFPSFHVKNSSCATGRTIASER